MFKKKILSIIAMLISSVFANCAFATTEEALFLENVARQYILAQFTEKNDNIRYNIKVSKVDRNRDFGGKCSGYLSAKLLTPEIKKNSIVKIICRRKNNPYSIQIPVFIIVQRATIVASDNIPKGSAITQSMLEKKFVNENLILNQSITDASSIIGSKTKKDIRAGDFLKISDLCLVAKGDIVTISARSHGLEIKASGIAMEEGKLNETIAVKNIKSGKIIRALVKSANSVEVVF